jgi:hypothetical protein
MIGKRALAFAASCCFTSGRMISALLENRIGVPTLAKRIRDANPEHEIQITTLQRFLTGHARTNEDYVVLFHRFADSLT